MPLLHLSISAEDAEGVARFLAHVMGGQAMPFPPFPECWIAFAKEDDGTAIEVYPSTHVLEAGPEEISCQIGPRDMSPSFAHIALGSVLVQEDILAAARDRGWTARTCNRGPFECVEVWLENRLLVEALDTTMLRDYRAGMTAANWARMFDLAR